MDTLLNWLWQGCAVAFGASAILQLAARLGPRPRYRIWWAAMILVLALPLVPVLTTTSVVPSSESQSATQPSAASISLPNIPGVWPLAMSAAWALWIMVHGVRLAIAARRIHRARITSRSIDQAVEARLLHWTLLKAHGRRAPLVVSDRVHTAAVLGVGSPFIAIAPAVIAHMPADDLDRVVVHEWTHVQRRDDLVNGIQLLVRMFVGWHPAVAWIDRHLNIEREVACDETTVAMTGSPKAYAACLARLAGLPQSQAVPLPIPGAISSSGLHARITRVFALRQTLEHRRGIAVAASGCLLLLAFTAIVGSTRLVGSAASVIPIPQVAALETTSEAKRGSSASVLPRSRVTAVPGERAAADRRAEREPQLRPARSRVRLTTSEASGRETISDGNPSASGGPVDLFPTEAEREPIEAVASPALQTIGTTIEPKPSAALTPEEHDVRAPWSAAADAGVAMGRGSRKAAASTAGVFTRFGKRLAGSF